MLNRIRRTAKTKAATLQFSPLPDDDVGVTELWEWRKKQYKKKDEHERAIKLRDVVVRTEGPIGILHFGDPHVDDDGTDLAAIEYHCQMVRETSGLFGANIGDVHNNWVGRLSGSTVNREPVQHKPGRWLNISYISAQKKIPPKCRRSSAQNV